MFDLLEDRAGEVIEVAQLQARELSHSHIGTEHLLLALTARDFGTATRVLRDIGVTQAAIRKEVIEGVSSEATLTDADAEALAAFGIDLDEIKRRVEESFGRSAFSTSAACTSLPHDVPLTPRAKEVVTSSVSEARRLGHASVRPEHLLLALLHDEKGLAVKLIRRIGAGPRVVRARTLRVISDRT